MQESEAQRAAEKIDQDAKCVLDREILSNNAMVEESRQELHTLQVESASVKTSGQAIAEAKAKTEAAEMSAQARVDGQTEDKS